MLGIGSLISMIWVSCVQVPVFEKATATTGEQQLLLSKTDLIPDPEPLLDTPPPGLRNTIRLNDPANIREDILYNPEAGHYEVTKTVGKDLRFGNPSYMTLDEYKDYNLAESVKEYWKEKKEAESFSNGSSGRLGFDVKGKGFKNIFGSNSIDIRPQGVAELRFGVNVSRTDNPQIPEKQRRISTFDFNETIQLNVVGNIGDKLKLTTSYNTEATFDFENQMKLEYTGHEDEIIQKIEAGNVSLPLTGSLITGSQSLFGVKTQLRFGRLSVTSIFSQQKGQRSEINVAGGAQISDFTVKADAYEANRHYFLAHYFRDAYDHALASLPIVNSGINITRIEVWVTNTNNTTQNTRNIIAFNDLGEAARFDPNMGILADVNPANGGMLPSNRRNNIYSYVANNSNVRGFFNANADLAAHTNPGGFSSAVHYEKVENARMLTPSEYTYNSRLGFISLNQALNNDEVLAVALEYTFGGETYQIGELSTDGAVGSNALILKLLKGTTFNPRLPIWDLMMKNVYNIGAYQVNRDDFILNLWYTNPVTGVDVNYIPHPGVDTRPLIQLLDMDKLNQNQSPTPDGVYDFVDQAATLGGTINARNGRVFFPVVEPFGSYLRTKLLEGGISQNVVRTIAFQELYDSTRVVAQQRPELNRFWLKGKYQSSSGSEISLNALNIPQGSVVVSAGGAQLTENVDYTVDYTLGRVKIINTGLLESQTPIKVSLESNSLFSIQTKRLLGSNFDYRINEDFNIGATVMNLTERPLTQKVNQGDEPINNTVVGLNMNYRTESQWLTSMVDKLPFYNTKEPSAITAGFEYAHLFPGHSKAIDNDDGGSSYIDDFEGSQSAIDIRSVNTWVLASTPSGQPDLWPEGDLDSFSLMYGMNRAKFAWYVIDPLFSQDNSLTPDHIKNDPDMQSNHYMRDVFEQEVFPNRVLGAGTPSRIGVMDHAFYPTERGPYSFDVEGSLFSDGLDPTTGLYLNPETRWGGAMRQIQTNDFEAANIEFIQFWLMDPFHYDNGVDPEDPGEEDGYDSDHSLSTHSGGELYIHLGNISEDILKDGYKSFENGLTVTGAFDSTSMATTIWGRVPTTQSIVNAFDNDPESRVFQDVGLDGLINSEEAIYHADYITALENHITNPVVLAEMKADPSNDGYTYYRNDRYDQLQLNILDRYKRYNGLEGNSPTSEQSDTINAGGYPTSATTLPDIEDINTDNNLSTTEGYYQYKISIKPGDLRPDAVGTNHITDVLQTTVNTRNGENRRINWYQFKVPIRTPDKVVNNIQDFRSIRFIRMVNKGFKDKVFMRFARLELIRGEWRKYNLSLLNNGEFVQDDPEATLFNISAVNIEENGSRAPIPYRLPPGIIREVNAATTNLAALNEQSMVMEVCNIRDGDARACFKNVDLDMRSYKRLKMFIHAEEENPDLFPLNDDDLTVFIRLGTDFNNNFYEYEVPLKVTPWYTDDETLIWPEANNIDVVFDTLVAVKRRRNILGGAVTVPFMAMDGDRRITIMGNPVLSDVKTIMIGIRNPGANQAHPWKPDDGLAKCAEIWVNELRLAEFDERGGWASTATLNTKLADLGTVNLAAAYSTPGWGALEQKISERQREEMLQVDASTNLRLGKFFGDKTGIRLPMFWGYTESWSNPQFDPLNPDQEFKDLVGELPKEEIQARRKLNQTYLRRRSLNFTNVRKERSKDAQKPRFYDVSNFSLSYAYNETFRRDINTLYNTNKTYRGGLNYQYSSSPKLWRPFAKSKILRKSDYLRLIKDVNLYLGPKQLGFSSDVMRNYIENETRINTEGALSIPQFTKQFQWNRVYDFKYDVSKALKVDFSANNAAIIGEPDGKIDKNNPNDTRWGPSYRQFKDSVWNSIRSWGATTAYNHTLNVNYTWPFSKLPLTSWITLTTRYAGSFNWQRAPFSQDTLGHTIQNSKNISWNAQFNMTTLYNKVPYLKKINQKYGRRGRNNRGRSRPTTRANTASKDSAKKSDFNPLEQATRLLMSLKNVSMTYSTTDGILLPGYDRSTHVMGQDPNFSAPGWGFVFGEQNEDWRGTVVRDFAHDAANKNWLVKQPNLNQQYANTHTDNLNGRATLEPLPGLRVELNASRSRSRNLNSFFRWGTDAFGDSMYVHDSPLNTGNLSMSVIMWRSAFAADNAENVSAVFERFKENRAIISQRLGQGNHNSAGQSGEFYDGYNGTSQDVLIPAFYAAYTGQSANNIGLHALKYIPAPNWRISFDGLSRNKWVKKWAKTVTLNHAYRSSFNIGSYTSNLNFATSGGFSSERDNIEGNFIPELQIMTITMSEQFSPLINVDITLNNEIQAKIELKRDRNLSLSLANYQLTEIRGNEIVIGAGYRLQDLKFPWKLGKKEVVSDLNIRADVTIRKNMTITREVDATPTMNQPTAGQLVISVKSYADYVLNERLNLRFFFDRVVTDPVIETTFKTANTNSGIALRFTLAS